MANYKHERGIQNGFLPDATDRPWVLPVVGLPPFEMDTSIRATNPLKAYFSDHEFGRGIWKWDHYFDIYHRHFMRFIGREVHVVEVGVYSGGSLEMWRCYFGEKCRVSGVDIRENCRCYDEPVKNIHVYVGDQGDRAFWKWFRDSVPAIDIVVDDGSHSAEHQMVTLQETLPYLRPGGVYLCEDVHGVDNRFATYLHSMANSLNAFDVLPTKGRKGPWVVNATPFQQAIYSIHLYPYVVVVEKAAKRASQFISSKRGTLWQPFM